MDALDLLEQQHNDVGALLDRARIATDAEERSALAAQVATLLVAHSHAEVRHVYAACADRLRRDDALRFDRACERHAEMRAAASALARGRLSEGVFRARLYRLRELFLEHEFDDERWIFQRSKCCFTDEQLDVFGTRIASASPIAPRGLAIEVATIERASIEVPRGAIEAPRGAIVSSPRGRRATRSRRLNRDRAAKGAEETSDPNTDHRRA